MMLGASTIQGLIPSTAAHAAGPHGQAPALGMEKVKFQSDFSRLDTTNCSQPKRAQLLVQSSLCCPP